MGKIGVPAPGANHLGGPVKQVRTHSPSAQLNLDWAPLARRLSSCSSSCASTSWVMISPASGLFFGSGCMVPLFFFHYLPAAKLLVNIKIESYFKMLLFIAKIFSPVLACEPAAKLGGSQVLTISFGQCGANQTGLPGSARWCRCAPGH